MKKISVALLSDVTNASHIAPVPVTQVNKYAPSRRNGFSPALTHILQEVQHELGMRQDPEILLNETELEDLVNQISERLGLELSRIERDEILAEIEKDQKPFGLLQELVDDPQVSDIIVTNYSKITIQQGRKNYSTGLSWPNQESYEAFVEKLLQKAGTTYSTKKPIADGMIGGFARLHVVHSSICDTGPYLTIRLNRFSSVAITDLIKAGLAPKEIFNYLQAITQSGQTLLIVGEVGTGKTTLARALAAAVPADESILVIEDTPEIKLEHPHVRYVTTREANTDGAGRIAPSECIRAGMRMAMNRIIFGEIRDAEAAEAFIDVCASGHPGLSTIHARSAAEALTRLELFLGRAQKGVQREVVSEQIATAVQVILFVDICKETGRRRIMEIKEVGPVADGVMRQRDMFRYQVQHGLPAWRMINKVSAHRTQLEDREEPVVLSQYPAVLELQSELAYREVVAGARN